MALPRFLVPHLADSSESVALQPEESHHAARVLRLLPGAEVALFDGRGYECRAVVESVSQGVVVCRRGPVSVSAAEPALRVTILQAALGGSLIDDVVRDTTMLGARAIEVVCAERSQISPAAIARRQLVPRWQRVATASAKQCGRALLPTITAWPSFDAALSVPREGPRLVLVEPSLDVTETWVPFTDASQLSEVHVLVGPEGGWTSAELTRAQQEGWQPWRLSALTLRADAAAAAALSVLSYLADARRTSEG